MLSIFLKNFSKKTAFICIMFFGFFSLNSVGENAKKSQSEKNQLEKEKASTKPDYDAIIKEYKDFVKTTKPEVRDEIKKYREKVADLNKQKSTLYKELSQEAQGYLKKEKAIRFKIPIEDRREYIKRIYSDMNTEKN
jgi:Skp family chaperone for outer membrane proteins